MRHGKQPATEELEDGATGAAELKVVKTPDSTSFTASLPRENASDLLPMVAILAIIAGPIALFHYAGVTATPWWVVGVVVLLQVVAVTTIVHRYRGRPRH
jgi:fatty acid desaturase